MFLLFLFFSTIISTNEDFHLGGFAESTLGFKLEENTKEELKINIQNYPKCDFFYIPLLKEKDEKVFREFFTNTGTEPLILLYLLKNYETYEEVLKKNRFDKLELLKRFLWALQIENKNNCPLNLNLKKPKISGFQDEISAEFYNLFLIYSFGDYQDSISFTSEAFEKDFLKDELLKLMQRYKIPLIHRNIKDKLPKKIKKIKVQ